MIASDVQPNIQRTGPSAASRTFPRLKLILLLAAIGFTAVIVLGLASRAAKTQAFQQVSDAAADIRVQVVFPHKSPASLELQLPGQTQAFYQAPIFAQTNGYLKNWHYDIGAKVKAGDILGEIDTPEVDQQLSQARANLEQAKAHWILLLSPSDASKTSFRGRWLPSRIMTLNTQIILRKKLPLTRMPLPLDS